MLGNVGAKRLNFALNVAIRIFLRPKKSLGKILLLT